MESPIVQTLLPRTLTTSTFDPSPLSFFRFGVIGERVVMTNEQGEWHHLDHESFRAFIEGSLEGEQADTLNSKGFYLASAAPDDVAERVRKRKRFVGVAPAKHLLIVSTADAVMTIEQAKDILDHVMLSPAGALELVLVAEGDIPLDLLRFIFEYTTEKNRYEGKTLCFMLKTDLKHMEEETAAWLVERRFRVLTYFHGTEAQHEAQRQATQGATFAQVTASLQTLSDAAKAARGRANWAAECITHVGAASVASPEEVVNAIQSAGFREFTIEPCFYGAGAISREAAGSFYDAALRQVIALNTEGSTLCESFGKAVYTVAQRQEPSSVTEQRSPSAGQALVYNIDGKVYPSPYALDLSRAGDEMFALGRVKDQSFQEIMSHPTLRTLALASLLECLPGYSDRWTTPYYGVDPVRTFAETQDLFPKMPSEQQTSFKHAQVVAVFQLLIADEPGTVSSMAAW